MEFNQTVTAALFVVLFGVLAVGTIMSPMQTSTVGMVLGGLLVFGLVTLFVGVKHGEYRASGR
jgi:lipopolysaccharide export LptBFGC system permease protein LptF